MVASPLVLFGIGRGFANWRRAQTAVYVNNIYRTFKRRHVPLQLAAGPRFDRCQWVSEFRQVLDSTSVFKAFYGPSGLGKSAAISFALARRQGVVRMTARHDHAMLLSEFAGAIGVSGRKVLQSKADKAEHARLVSMFETACTKFKDRFGFPVVLFIEDVHR